MVGRAAAACQGPGAPGGAPPGRLAEAALELEEDEEDEEELFLAQRADDFVEGGLGM